MVCLVVQAERIIIVLDASGITTADEATLDALARLQLTACRLGASIRLRNARPELLDLLSLTGLAGVIEADSGIDSDRLPEQRKEVGVDEEVDPRDAAL